LFDLDGTLLDLGNIRNYADQILVKTLEKLNVDKIPSRKERKELWFFGEDFQKVLNEWGITDSNNFWKFYDETDFEKRKCLLRDKKISLFEDVKTILELIRNHQDNKKLAICTNTADYIVNYFLNYFNIKQYFHEIFSMGDADQDFAKPSPRGILIILKRLNFDPQINKAIMIGDSIHDIRAAREANISSCLIDHSKGKKSKRYNKWKIQPDYIIEDLNELTDL
jgi:phosphoglycolate phosphatase-like HAD superfamily hydrolase